MSGRSARRQRAQERQRMEQLLREVERATPELVDVFGLSDGAAEAWKVGPALVVVPTLRDDWPADLKAAIDRRRRASLSGRCDCGARRRIRGGGLVVEHERECPAGDKQLHAIAAEHGMRPERWL